MPGREQQEEHHTLEVGDLGSAPCPGLGHLAPGWQVLSTPWLLGEVLLVWGASPSSWG